MELRMVKVVLSTFFFTSRRRHTRLVSDWSSDVCSSDLEGLYAPFTGFFPSGWEIAPIQPRHPRPEAAGAFMPSEAGVEAKFVPTAILWGWEGQPSPLRRTINYGPAVGGSADFVSFFFQPFNWEIPSFQPPHPRPERAGAITTSEPGIEAKFVPAART